MQYLISLLFLFMMPCVAAQTPAELPLYPGAVPNSKPAGNLEKTAVNEWGVLFTTGTSVPTITPYLPENPNGAAVVIFPGGGYIGTAGGHEGKQVAEALIAHGITAFVVKYRIPDDRYCVDKSLAPLQDAQQAIRLVRKNAAAWKVLPGKIGILGFSAGGHLAATAATHFSFKADPTEKDTTSVRPDFVALIYAVISFSDTLAHAGSCRSLLGEHPTGDQIRFFSNELQVTQQSPPAFLVHAGDDDGVKVDNSLAYYRACLNKGVPAEMHLYARGGHGFGLHNATTEDDWLERMLNWINSL